MTHTSILQLSRPGKWNYKIPWLPRFSTTHTNHAVCNLHHTLSGWTCNSSFSLSKFPRPASLIIIDPMSVELLIRRWSNKELSDWSKRKTSMKIKNLNSVLSLKLKNGRCATQLGHKWKGGKPGLCLTVWTSNSVNGIKFYLFPFVTVEIVLVLQLLNMDAAAVVRKMM